ncbi:MAG: polysaccharide pyruvyl transferase family protein, partial [Xanthobacteraceae bacterium]
DRASQGLLREIGVDAAIGGCPTLFLPESPTPPAEDGPVLISVRHPSRMSVPPVLKWRIAEDLRRLIACLQGEFGHRVKLLCHDYIDLEFAAGFADVPTVYFDDVYRYTAALRSCSLSLSYRLHAFLPCIAFGTPSIHLSYDERGHSMIETIGLEDWNIDLLTARDCVSDVMDRVHARATYHTSRAASKPAISAMQDISIDALRHLRRLIMKS